MIEYIYKEKVIYRAEKVPVPRIGEYIYFKDKMYKTTIISHLVEKKIIQVHLSQ